MKHKQAVCTLVGAALTIAAAMPWSVAAQDATATPVADPLAASMPESHAEMMAGAAQATLMDVDGNVVGEVTVHPLDETHVSLQVSAQNLPPGFHGFHVHTTGTCDPSGDSPFSSAGGHLNPEGTGHGDHGGDLPVLYVTAAGIADMTVMTDRFSIDQLMDEDGGAIVVHANSNNYANIPERYGGPDEETLKAGDAGPRIACGVFTGDGMGLPAPEATTEATQAAG